MDLFRHRRASLVGLPALVLLIAATGCSSADDNIPASVPSPGAKATKLCQNLDKSLPRKVDGLDREDPEPRSALTAGWGSPAIILRCGVSRPAKMVDPKVANGDDPVAIGGVVNGIDWLMEKREGGVTRFTSAQRRVYVEVTVPSGRDTSSVLVDLTEAIKKEIPSGIAD
ncbi:hypothetical protein GCM10010372_50170 [Streptomyces tauricus]|uniref:DUF3515 domain-containing protein n=1 Tax=Streptomyces tauricus TaxID=68274 RepID=A0ABZ1JGZ6_9ACTN|nr:DUF3515 domain-containing protein [Streptomyces tauricus]MCW8100241.1 DUF3515 domain-containing protein [Streptomyces tauricus]GHA44058.1 hypothetical protein GCM10010372_50170 [Streptomyces tauricus]